MSNVLSAKTRSNERKSQLTELRQQGGIPGVVYGYKVENTSISINRAEFTKTMREVGRNGVISLDLEGENVNVILHEYQEDPIRREVIHADFLAVDMDVAIEANVRVDLLNDPVGAKEGGVLQQILHEVIVTAKPDAIPEVIEVDISGLNIGDTITIAEIKGNYACEINHEDDEAIATVTPPRDEEETTDSDEQQEPELIGEDSSDEE
ncbi:50S ribosomal protein L25/general stress protein Ctc [Pseudogracilibacillus auburnensis]|uniref:50S ribosomal protein L25/general stress protein Ctc n=1 Tax=Pseudogracilibacillus auburnensis TaxID=1494959 RepID=UPI001A95CC11|nr:50S ribosomal protein L25/general stress protein Ctc [Pseudogracilibacillus auburnensis]MBO1004722.1 50S ribosomal protein L25/general stress protein Ctc [Pseudogracilibacillus auburnensis]